MIPNKQTVGSSMRGASLHLSQIKKHQSNKQCFHQCRWPAYKWVKFENNDKQAMGSAIQGCGIPVNRVRKPQTNKQCAQPCKRPSYRWADFGKQQTNKLCVKPCKDDGEILHLGTVGWKTSNHARCYPMGEKS